MASLELLKLAGSTEDQSEYANEIGKAAKAAERRDQCNLLRDIFGPLPFRSITLDPSWLSPTVKQLAEVIYQERQFDRLPLLADALEDSGCSEQEVLKHLRSGGEHVRGCWCLDLVLGKS